MTTRLRFATIRRPGASGAAGFSLLEVLIALVILAVGLLGLALLQTMNLRYTKGADQRTQAVNLAGELLDMMRANSSEVAAYAIAAGAFPAGTVPATGCTMNTILSSASNLARWQCQVREALGPEAKAVVTVTPPPAVVTISVTWGEGGLTDLNEAGRTVTLVSQL